MKRHLYILLIFIGNSSFGQNLVPNPSFENIIECPINSGYPCPSTNIGSFDKVFYWTNPICTSSDILNSCTTNTDISIPTNFAGYQAARNGNSYAGLFTLQTSNSEYISSPLTNSLVAGSQYLVSFYVSCGSSPNWEITNGTNGIGAYLSIGFPDTTGSTAAHRLFSPAQVMNPPSNLINDTTNWVLISDTITAIGGESYITIGNFTPTAQLQGDGVYFYVDDVTVQLLSTVSVTELQEEKSIQINPNPTVDKVNIKTLLDIEEIKIVSTFGIDVTAKTKAYYFDRKNISIDVTNLDNGIYFTIIKYKRGKSIADKFVKK